MWENHGLSHGSYVLQHHQDALMRTWTMVHEAVNDSSTEPFVKANDEPAYNYYGKNSEMNSLMLNAMSGVSVPFIKAILEGYDGFQGVKTLVDVGGSGGDCLKMILEKHTNIELGINFDLPEVVEKAPQIPRLFWQLAWHAENKAQYVRILETCSLKVNVFASVGTFLLWKDNYGLAPVAKYLCSFWSASIMLILSYLYRCKSEGLDTTKPLVSRSTFLGLTQLVFSVGLGERNCATYFIQVFVVLTIGVGIFDTGAGNDLPTRNSVDAKILVHLIVVWAVGTCPLFIPWYTTLLMVNLHNTFMVLHSLRSWIKQLTMISIQHYGLENKTEHMWLPLSYGIVITLLFNGIDGKKYVSPYESDILLLLTLFYLNLEDKVLIEGESIVVNRVGYVMAYGLEFVETNLVGIIGPSKMLERLI